MAHDIFLKRDGIEREALGDTHKNDIELLKRCRQMRHWMVSMLNALSKNLSCTMLMAGWLLTAAGCSGTPTVKEQTQLDIRIEASDSVNPDEKGRPSPILVRVYELRSDTAFNTADFYSLQDSDRATLGADLLVSDEYILRPGDIKVISRKSNSATSVVGILAGYQALGRSQWRETCKLREAPDAAWYRFAVPAPKARINVNLGQNAIVMTELD